MSPQSAAPATPEIPANDLGRAWVGPALLLAGAATLARVEIRAELAAHAQGVPADWASWAVLGQWPAEWIAAGVLSGAATLIIWGVRGPRRVLGCVLALLLLTSAITAWPLEAPSHGNPFSAYSPWKLVGLVLAAVLPIPLLAMACEASGKLQRLLSSTLLILLCALCGLVGPGYLLWQRSADAPSMNVQRILETLGAGGNLTVGPDAAFEWVVPAGTGQPMSLGLRPWLEADAECTARFEVQVDGVLLHSDELHSIEHLRIHGERHELPVEAGQSIRFSTAYEPAPTAGVPAPTMGFGELRLQTNVSRPRTRTRHDRYSLLFITVDSLRSDRLGCYGHKRFTSPAIDSLARRGTLFESAFSSSSWDWPSSASLFSGLAPQEHGLLQKRDGALDPSVETLAEALQAGGFSTAAILGNPSINRAALFDQGFESFDASPLRRSSQQLLGAVRTKLTQLSHTRFFLYLQLSDTEAPRQPLDSQLQRLGLMLPAPQPEADDQANDSARPDPTAEYTRLLYEGAGLDESGDQHPERLISSADALWLQDQYDASVGSVDQAVGLILKQLQRLELLDKTIVVLTGSHGEELLDHGLLSHGHSVDRELVQVPLILAGPGIASGVRIAAEVSNRHVAPTVAELLGIPMAGASDSLNLLQAGLESSGVFYQTSRARWRGSCGIEILGSRRAGFVVQWGPDLPGWGTPTAGGRALRIFSSEQDMQEWTDLSPAPAYLKRALLRAAELQQHKAQGLARRLEREGRAAR